MTKLVTVLFFIIFFILPFSVHAASKQKYKTYTNSTARYSVKYPSHWRPHEQAYDASFVYFDYGEDQISIPDQSTAVTIGPTPIGSNSLYTSDLGKQKFMEHIYGGSYFYPGPKGRIPKR